jgi:hypothetical protein
VAFGQNLKGGDGQFEIGLFGDYSHFEELEERVKALIQNYKTLQNENSELKTRIFNIERELQEKSNQFDLMIAQRDILIKNQRDPVRDELIKQKILDLIEKIG